MNEHPPTENHVARRTVDGDLIEWLEVPERARLLNLEPHPEGGWYRRTWTGTNPVETENGVRPAATLIYFLLPPGENSVWHRVSSDEIWLWHGPGSLVLEFGGSGEEPQMTDALTLGPAPQHGDSAQALVPAGTWQRTIPSATEVLVSCLVSPGFSFDDWQLTQEG